MTLARLPEQVLGVRRVGRVVCQIIRQEVKLGVGVSKQDYFDALPGLPVPVGTGIRQGAIGVSRRR